MTNPEKYDIIGYTKGENKMKLKCYDGIVRDFSISKPSWKGIGFDEACCLICNHNFGIHDTKIIKEEFKKHVCIGRCKTCDWKGINFAFNNYGEPRCPNCDSGQRLYNMQGTPFLI